MARSYLILGFICVLLLVCSLMNTVSYAKSDTEESQPTAYDPEMDCTRNVHFTPYQRKELNTIYQKIYADYSHLIEEYAWAGALTADQKKLRYRMLYNYIHTFSKRNYQWCSEHETDEWEEEWYNSDNE